MARKFTVTPHPSSKKEFSVLVFNTRLAMARYLKRQGRWCGPCLAQCSTWRTVKWNGKAWIPRPSIGELVFSIDTVTPEIVAHEATHAAVHALWTATRRQALRFRGRRGVASAREELLCEMVARLVVHIGENIKAVKRSAL